MRKPVIELRGGIAPRQRIWDAIRSFGVGPGVISHWTEAMIIEITRLDRANGGAIDPATLRSYRVALEAAGVINAIYAVSDQKYYRLVRDEGVDAPRLRRDGTRVTQGLKQENMWRTLRMMRGDINAAELAAHASSSTVEVSKVAATDYLATLAKAGYLDITQRGKGTGRGGVAARYALRADMDTGPKPPMVCRTSVVFDANQRRVMWAPTVTEDDADV